MAVPFPRANTVLFQLSLHLLNCRCLVGGILDLIPVMIRGEVALAQRPLWASHLVQFLGGLRHQPAREYSTTARTALERDASIILLLFLSGHTRYHAHHGFAVKEDLFDKVIEAVSLNVVLEIET